MTESAKLPPLTLEAKSLVHKIISENAQVANSLKGKARAIYEHLLKVAQIDGGNVRPCRVGPGSPPIVKGAGFYGSSPGAYWGAASTTTTTTITFPHHNFPITSFDEPLETSEPKLVDGLSNKDWWELGKEIVKD